MEKTALVILGFAVSFCFGFFFKTTFSKSSTNNIDAKQTWNSFKIKNENNMKLGAFSVSLSVKDIMASKKFYESLGFTVLAGALDKNYLIMKNENSLIGLFQGMFKNNILTFNPGWDENGKNIDKFDDIREIQKRLKNEGIAINPEADENTSGAASLMITDPDGNVVLIDQHR